MRLKHLLAGLGLALSIGLLTPRVGQAHASPTRAEPGIEQVVPAAPTQLRVWFSEELAGQGSSLEVMYGSGARVDSADTRLDMSDPDRKLLMVSLGALPEGVYTVNWRSLSRDDGHEASGSFRFGVGASTVLPPAGGASAAPSLAVASAALDGNALRVQMSTAGVTIRQPPANGADAHASHEALDASGGHGHEMASAGGGHGHDMAAASAGHDHGAAASGEVYGHLHVYLNGVDVLHAYDTAFSLADLPSGSHNLRIELVGEQHAAWNPTVATTLTVLVP